MFFLHRKGYKKSKKIECVICHDFF